MAAVTSHSILSLGKMRSVEVKSDEMRWHEHSFTLLVEGDENAMLKLPTSTVEAILASE